MSKLTRKEEIKHCAARLFRKRGFTATSMRDIAKEMGIEAPSLYNHIKGKQEILQELLLELANRFSTEMDHIFKSKLRAINKLERLVKLHVDMTVEHPDAIALVTSDWVHLEEPAFSHFIEKRDHYEKLFKKIIRKSVKEGDLENMDVEIAMFSILSTLRWLYSWVLKHPNINPIALEQEMILNLISGIRKQ